MAITHKKELSKGKVTAIIVVFALLFFPALFLLAYPWNVIIYFAGVFSSLLVIRILGGKTQEIVKTAPNYAAFVKRVTSAFAGLILLFVLLLWKNTRNMWLWGLIRADHFAIFLIVVLLISTAYLFFKYPNYRKKMLKF